MVRSILVRLSGSPGPTVFGMTVQARNERAIARGGASVTAETMAEDRNVRTLVVPENVVLEPSLFGVLDGLEPPRRLRAPDGAVLDWGSVSPETPIHELSGYDFLDVSSETKRRRAERLLLLRTEKSTDGPVARVLNRPQSRFFSFWFLKMGLSANAASALSLLIGLGCGYAAAQPGALWLAATGILFQFASMFDGVDGEMARVTLRDSKLGAAIDAAADNLTYLATLVGFGIGWAREGITTVEGGSLVTVSALIVLTLLRVLLFVRKYAPNASFVFFDSSLRRAARESDSLSFRIIDIFFRATRRDLLALILMFASFFGSRFFIFCLVGIGVLVADYVLLFRRAELVHAAGLLRAEEGR
ncbi:MAG: CDP-alcohol phosphatidyltransferase family protein [Polyangiales bacterium]